MAQTPDRPQRIGLLRRGAPKDPEKALQGEAAAGLHWFTRPSRRRSILSARDKVAENARVEQARVEQDARAERNRILVEGVVSQMADVRDLPVLDKEGLRGLESTPGYRDAIDLGIQAKIVEYSERSDVIRQTGSTKEGNTRITFTEPDGKQLEAHILVDPDGQILQYGMYDNDVTRREGDMRGARITVNRTTGDVYTSQMFFAGGGEYMEGITIPVERNSKRTGRFLDALDIQPRDPSGLPENH